MWVAVNNNDDPTIIIDKHFALVCPHCHAKSNLTAVSTPRFSQIVRYKPTKVVIGYRCDSCNDCIALRFKCQLDQNNRLNLVDEYEELERHMETFDYQYLPATVAADFKEALTCFSISCLNATAAMCRRTIQSVAVDLGATGSDKVMKQVLEIKDAAGIDDDTFLALKQSVIDGHDGAHPHLPSLTPNRVGVLVTMMKDVLYQLYVRKAKVQEAMKLRQDAIDAKKP